MLRHIDLFAGIGGFSYALRGLAQPVLAVDTCHKAIAVYRNNHAGEAVVATVESVPTAEIPQAEIITAGLPCQPFSIANKDKTKDADCRADNWRELPRWAKASGAAIVLVENVYGFIHSEAYRGLCRAMQGLGYADSLFYMNATDYGVPQARKRIFVVFTQRPLSPFTQPVHVKAPSMAEFLCWSGDNPCAGKSISNFTLHKQPLDRFERRLHLIGVHGNNRFHAQGAGIWDAWGHSPTFTHAGREYALTHRWYRRDNGEARYLSTSEAIAVMGYGADFSMPNDTMTRSLLGNSICPPVVRALFESIRSDSAIAVLGTSKRPAKEC